MPKVRISSVIDAPIEKVWARIRDFNGLPGWHPRMVESEIEDGKKATDIGSVRNFKVASGATIREKLLAFSDDGHLVSYSIIETSGADLQPHLDAQAEARHRRRPHLCRMDGGLRRAGRQGRRDRQGHGRECLPGRLQCAEEPFLRPKLTLEEGAMPLALKTYPTLAEAGSALKDAGARYLGGGTLVVRAANEGDVSLSTFVRSTDPALSAIKIEGGTATIGASVTMAADRPPPGLSAHRQGGARGRRPGDPQHGDRRRQSFRAGALWRFRRRAAGARRDRPDDDRRSRHRGVPGGSRRQARRHRHFGQLRRSSGRRIPLRESVARQAEGRFGAQHRGRPRQPMAAR